MAQRPPADNEDEPEHVPDLHERIPELLAAATGRDSEAFEFDPDDYEFPAPGDLESIDEK